MTEGTLQILHVEDDAGDRDLIQLAIRRAPASTQIAVAVDGEEAFELLKSAAESNSALPQVILLDLNLPRKDGRQLLAEIKQHPRLKLIPVIILTTSNALNDIQNCYRQGAACYVIKPLDFNELVNIARRLVDFWSLVEFVPNNLLLE